MSRFEVFAGWLIACLSLALVGCGGLPAKAAMKDGRIALKVAEADVLRAAGPPDLIIARRGVETFLYDAGDGRAAVVAFLDKQVIAFDDSIGWPVQAAKATKEADDPVAKGAVRVGMSEAELVQAMHDPDGITAKGGVETFHWVSDDEVDSVVQLIGGKVIGFWDRPISKYTQNLPTEDRDQSTTDGRIRVGMKEAEVKKILGDPDGVSAKKGVTTHRYESDPVIGDEIWYAVDYDDGVVVNLHEFNVSRDEDQKEEAEEARVAAAAAAEEEEAGSSVFSIFDNPLVKAAVGVAVGAAVQGAGGKKQVSHKTVESSAERTLKLNGKTYTGGEHLGRPCSISKACPSGYTCNIMAGDSGVCVQ
jgi:hypothetical protein